MYLMMQTILFISLANINLEHNLLRYYDLWGNDCEKSKLADKCICLSRSRDEEVKYFWILLQRASHTFIEPGLHPVPLGLKARRVELNYENGQKPGGPFGQSFFVVVVAVFCRKVHSCVLEIFHLINSRVN